MNLGLLALAVIADGSAVIQEPTPIQPIPSKRQLRWHDMERYAFVHFGPNTFTGEEWGSGKERVEIFNPERLDCNQWVRVLKATGFKGVIITAKHHDGFCLWPSKFSTHTVKQSLWRGGQGDVLRELSNACKKGGIKFGVYLSPWDRNHPTYGTPEYNDTYKGMLKEVLTGYGPVFEVWFDGANGEGPNGKRQVYDWPGFVQTVRKYQPNAVIFSDAGPDIRWVGNESGYAGDPCWGMLRKDEFAPGVANTSDLESGQIDGTDWVPAECDVSIRPGWFWRASENSKVKSVDHLLDIYFKSVGRGSSMLLNIPPNSDGLISQEDIDRLEAFDHSLRQIFRTKLKGKIVVDEGSQSRTLTFGTAKDVGVIQLGEPIAYGQRVKKFRLETHTAEGWKSVFEGNTIGRKRLIRLNSLKTDQLRLTILDSRGQPLLSDFCAYQRN